jgi:uncharacterized protein involved in response to NO
MAGIPRYRPDVRPALLSAGFRPFFLAAALWAAAAVPLWLLAYGGALDLSTALPTALPAPLWHLHAMVFGFAGAAVAGYLLTIIPNWTGRMPLQGAPLAGLLLLWAVGRIAVLISGRIGAPAAALLDLAFPVTFLLALGREIVAGRNWRNLPPLAALALLLAADLLMQLEALGLTETAAAGGRLGLAALLGLIALIGGRIVPSFTRSWLRQADPRAPGPAPGAALDRALLAATLLALAAWVAAPDAAATALLLLAGGLAAALRLACWQGWRTWREPLLLGLHLGQAWLAAGLLLLGLASLRPVLPPTAALHALTVGAIGTMILAVMARAALSHTGRPVTGGPDHRAMLALVTLAALLRVLAPLAGAQQMAALAAAGLAWSAAFALFLLRHAGMLARPRQRH